ncbi:MAG: Grx4 family monothiol glutaredoxin [Acidobacteria bacterium]|nr:Grx4 family monothiol glutaredoxin [Acidobacteriota bacterium]MCB9398171.1 Grx4 family monothiol glutaredoxin [Acidobacteriota bacterium]
MNALHERIKNMVQSEPLFLFMKGNPTFPRCGFSNQVVQILKSYKVPFGHFDILSDEDMRQGVKEFGDWPTFPQLYILGDLYGGCDIVREAYQSGELLEALQEALPNHPIEIPKPPGKVQHIGPAQAKIMLEENQALFLDVRTPEERACASIPGFELLDQKMAQSVLDHGDKDKPIVFLCHYGGRSAQAADYFAQQGFQKVFNVAGGIDEWSKSVDSSIPRY